MRIAAEPMDSYPRAGSQEEMARRKSKLNPAGRPKIDGSPAIKALRAALAEAHGVERERIQAALDRAMILYRPDDAAAAPDSPAPAVRAKRGFRAKPGTMRALVAELLQIVDHKNRHGVAVGLPFVEIRRRAIARFPVVMIGRFKGRPSTCNGNEMGAISAAMRASGVWLPLRPRSPRGH